MTATNPAGVSIGNSLILENFQLYNLEPSLWEHSFGDFSTWVLNISKSLFPEMFCVSNVNGIDLSPRCSLPVGRQTPRLSEHSGIITELDKASSAAQSRHQQAAFARGIRQGLVDEVTFAWALKEE